ncbi:COMM domain-containing protein 3-like [Styela clava]|uniref:COMM domain-containing protein 3-like n=1 Tax=Styela clava TaxID=7725 RepID=UPI00193A867F|nr:COMM domain-containing protein 3-like [Styela clava]XP_039257595.1 COMM domain-containing protein 3-like [Styela clava]
MELLSQPTLTALQVCGTVGLPEKCFRVIVKNALDCIFSQHEDEILIDKDTVEIDAAILKQTYLAIMTLFVEASKTDTSSEQFSMVLDDCKLLPKQKEILQESYKLNKQKVRSHLARINKGLPHVVDIDWRLDYNMKNSQLNKVMDLKYTLSFKTEQQLCGEINSNQEDNVQFSCTREQLQDFVGKLKEAVKSVERASQS